MISLMEQQAPAGVEKPQTEEEARTDTIDEIEIVDNSGFDEASVFGNDKLTRPSEYGLKAASKSADEFTNASDGEDTDVDMIFQDAFPDGDGSGFDKDHNSEIPNEEPFVDPATIPAVAEEEDQFDDTEDEEISDAHITDSELASDDDEKDIEEVVDEAFADNGNWNDLF